MLEKFSFWVACASLAIVCLWIHSPILAQGQGVKPAPSVTNLGNPSESKDPNASKPEDTDLDKILDMDIESLGKVAVHSTLTDPIVEAVSKTPEKASEAPGIVDVITAKDIEEFGAKNLYEVLNWATSVYMTGSFLFPKNVASMRGDLIKHEDNHVLLLINGRPFRDTTAGGINLSIYTAFPIQTIERVEVIRGPGSVLYGTNAFTGVINVVTKDPKKPTLHASVLSGSYGWQSYSAASGNGNKDRGYYSGTSYNRSKGWPFTATSEPPLVRDTEPFGQDNVGVFAMYRNQGFTANLFAANCATSSMGPLVKWPLVTLQDRRVFLDFGYLLELNQQQSLSINFTYNYDDTDFPSALSTPTVEVPFIMTAHSFLLEGTYRAEISPDFHLMLGGTADFHTGCAVTGTLDSVPWFEEIWYSTYLQLEYHINEQLKLIGGMQGHMPGTIRGGIVPRAGVIATLDENWTAKLLFGQAFRSPYQLERSVNVPGVLVGNPNLIPEIVQTLDVQLAYATKDYRFAATYFHSDFYDLVNRIGTLPQTYSNGSSMESQGVELENEWRFSKRLRWTGSVTYQNNILDGVPNSTNAPIWMAKMGMAYNKNGLNVGLMDVFFGEPNVPSTALQVNHKPNSYHLVSLNTTLDLNRRFNWKTNRQMKLQFLVQNLLNESINAVEFEREIINTIPADAGRTFYGGLTVQY